MFCVVKFPDNINAINIKAYHKSAKNLYQKLNLFKDKIKTVVAIGHEKNKSLWPGDNWASQFNFIESGFKEQSNENVVVIGLDAPFLSANTINQFLSKCSRHKQDFNSSAACTFRKIPLQNNTAALEHGGKMLFSLTHLNKTLALSMDGHDSTLTTDDIDISIRFPKKEVHIKSKSHLQFIVYDIDKKNQRYWNTDTSDETFNDKRLKYLKKNNVYQITFFDDCVVHILDIIDAPALYSKIHYVLIPVTINGVIELDENQLRFNEQTLEKITGRQAFPNLYEPFLGIVLLKQFELLNFIIKGNNWFKDQENLKPLIINEKESKLISEDTVFIISDWEKIQDIANN